MMPVRLEIHPITKPLASSDDDVLAYEKEMEEQRHRDLVGYDIRFTKFLGYTAVVSLALISGAITWSAATLVGLKSDVAVLLARPLGVSKDQYERDARRWDYDIEELKDMRKRERNGG